MQELMIEPTVSSPRVELGVAGRTLRISGESYPENSFEFYQPIIQWIEAYIADHEEMVLDLSLSYLNTSSIRCLLEIMDGMNDAFGKGKRMQIDWHYDPENERALELAEEFMEDLDFIFNLIPDTE